MDRIRKDFGTLTLVMIPVAIAINIAIGTVIYNLKVPLYLDSIGTVLVGVLAGPWAGALTGLLSNLIWGLSGINPQYTPFGPVAAVIGLMAALFSEIGWLRTWWKVIFAGVITGLVAAVISAPISAYVFGGVTGSGTDLVVAFWRNMGLGILPASFAQGVSSDPLDKTVTFLVVWAIVLGLPARFLARFPRAENVRGSGSVPVMPGSMGGGSAVAAGMPSTIEPVNTQSAVSGSASVATEPPSTKPTAKKATTSKTTSAKKTPAKPAAKAPAAKTRTPAKPGAKTTTRKPSAK